MNAAADRAGSPLAPAVPQPVVAVGVTGHRTLHASYPADTGDLAAAIEALLARIERAAEATTVNALVDARPRFRLASLLADGADQLGAEAALARNWEILAPLPFGAALNTALASVPLSAEDARAILAGEIPGDPGAAQRAERTRALTKAARTFEIAERDAVIERAFLRSLEAPGDPAAHTDLQHETAQRARIAGQILIEQCDILIAVWDGQSTINVGGTGHTARRALEAGVPVLWIDPQDPSRLRLVRLPEALETGTPMLTERETDEAVRALVGTAIGLGEPPAQGSQAGLTALSQAAWRDASSPFTHAFRRVEALFGEATLAGKFGSLKQRY